MRFFTFIIFLFIVSFEVRAQGDLPSPLYIPPAENAGVNIKPEKKESLFDIKPKAEPAPNVFKKEEPSVFAPGEVFINPGDRFRDKLNKSVGGEGKGDNKSFRRHQSFGEFKTDSEVIRVAVRDPQAIDGDKVKIYHNGIAVYSTVYLVGDFKTIEIRLSVGFNKIVFEALNEGSSFPNTGAFVIIDKGNSIYQEEWNLATGFSASFLIIKE